MELCGLCLGAPQIPSRRRRRGGTRASPTERTERIPSRQAKLGRRQAKLDRLGRFPPGIPPRVLPVVIRSFDSWFAVASWHGDFVRAGRPCSNPSCPWRARIGLLHKTEELAREAAREVLTRGACRGTFEGDHRLILPVTVRELRVRDYRLELDPFATNAATQILAHGNGREAWWGIAKQGACGGLLLPAATGTGLTLFFFDRFARHVQLGRPIPPMVVL